jgi:flavin reductase (DIM6/NTAB) family NADH-FMN oxidoreductase RutF
MFTADDWQLLFTTLVAPRPIALVSSISLSGKINLAPFSSYTPVCDDPPTLLLAIQRRSDGTRKHTARNILATRECAVSVVDSALARQMVMTSTEKDCNEFQLAGIEEESCVAVSVPRIRGAAATFECLLSRHHEVATTADCYYLSVKAIWIHDRIVTSVTARLIEEAKGIAVVGACSISNYMTTSGMILIRNPTE